MRTVIVMQKVNKKLFCIPYAGGSISAFHGLKDHIKSDVQVIGLELPGRGTRYSEPLCQSFNDLLEDLYKYVENEVDNSQFALFGHSLGGLLAYELSYMIKERTNREPLHIFFSGINAPSLKDIVTDIHKLPDNELQIAIRELGGTPEFILKNEIFTVFQPIIRSDFKVYDNYVFTPKKERLDCDISILNGDKDKNIEFERLETWKDCTNKNCYFYTFAGGHFYLFDHLLSVVNIINNAL